MLYRQIHSICKVDLEVEQNCCEVNSNIKNLDKFIFQLPIVQILPVFTMGAAL